MPESGSATDEWGKPAENEELWRFSLAFYDAPSVAEALITLQDCHGFDVNLMLFALWLGISGRGALGADLLAAAEHATRTIRNEIIDPLRALRRKLRHHSDGGVQHLREGVKALELAAEKLAQLRLAGIGAPKNDDTSPPERTAAAGDNLAFYLGPTAVTNGPEVRVILEAVDAFAERSARVDGPYPSRSSAGVSPEGSPQRLTTPVSRSNRSRTRPRV